MIKIGLLIVGVFFFASSSNGQSDNWLINKVSTEICTQLEEYDNLDQISKREVAKIFYGTILKYKGTWNKQLENFPNSEDQNARDSYYYLIIDHRLLFDCSEYRQIAHLINNTHADNPSKRKQHLSVREFVTMAELDKENEVLLSYFNQNLHGQKLTTDLENIKRELNIYKHSSVLNIISSGNEFFINLQDYKSGNSNLQLTLIFDNEADQYINDWNYVLKEELDSNKVDLEEAKLEMDFDDIMALPPTAPPSDNIDSLKREDNKR